VKTENGFAINENKEDATIRPNSSAVSNFWL
jgi:hypothetical protein